MKVIIDKRTVKAVTELAVRTELSNTSVDISVEGLEGTPFTVIDAPDQPTCNATYRYNVLNDPSFDGVSGDYTITWKTVTYQRDIKEVYDLKLVELEAACRSRIIGGFTSTALGEPYRYSSTGDDQRNIQGNILDAILGEECQHVCYAIDGTKAWMTHTPEQMIQVGRDLKRWIVENRVHCDTLKAQVEAAYEDNAVDTLIDIVWRL